MKRSLEAFDNQDDDSLAPGDLFIDTTNVTLFQVMDNQHAGCTPWEIEEALGITTPQVLAALEYIEQHRTDVEAAYLANSRTTAQQFIHKLVGNYRPAWTDRVIPLGRIGMGVLFSIISIIIVRQSIVSPPITQDIVTILIKVLFFSIFGLFGLIMMFLSIRLLIDSFSLQYTITETAIIATRYGGIPAYSIPVTSIVEAYPNGQFLHITCEDGETYRIVGLKQLREVANSMPTRESDVQR